MGGDEVGGDASAHRRRAAACARHRRRADQAVGFCFHIQPTDRLKHRAINARGSGARNAVDAGCSAHARCTANGQSTGQGVGLALGIGTHRDITGNASALRSNAGNAGFGGVVDEVTGVAACDRGGTGQCAGNGQGLGRGIGGGVDVQCFGHFQRRAIHAGTGGVADGNHVDRRTNGRSATASYRTCQGVGLRVVRGIYIQNAGPQRAALQCRLGRVADHAPAHRALDRHVVGSTHRHRARQDLGFVVRTQRDFAGIHIQIGAFDECQRVVADIIDSECRANGYLRAQRCSTGQGADEGFVAGVERDVARGEGGAVLADVPLRIRDTAAHQHRRGIANGVVRGTADASEIASAAANARAHRDDIGLVRCSQGNSAGRGRGQRGVVHRYRMRVLDGVVGEGDARIVAAHLHHAGNGDD